MAQSKGGGYGRKSATSPNPAADKEVHKFTCSIPPHGKDYREAGTVRMAYLLNNPLHAVPYSRY